MYEAIRIFWNLAAIGGAIAVGLITQSAGLIAVTLLGGLFVPRLLGLVPRGPRGFRGFGWGPGSCMGRGGHGRGERFEAWHRDAHGQPSTPSQPAATSQI